MEKLYEIDDLVDTFWNCDLDEIAYRECITNLIGTKSLGYARNVDSKKMYARVLLECLLTKDVDDEEVNLEEIFHPNIMKWGCYQTQPLGMMKVLQKIRLEKEYLKDKIHFGLIGKFEKRKHTAKIIKAWAKKYGNNYKYQLSCLITNPFLKSEQMNQMLQEAVEGKHYGNINFIPYLKTNSEVNDLLNAIQIDLSGCSGAEGWNLPSFNSTALGKWSIVLNSSSHKDWATDNNSILLQPNGKELAADGLFFGQDTLFNQGNIYTFDTDEFISAMETAESKAETINEEGLKLQKEFTYEKSLNKILELIQNDTP